MPGGGQRPTQWESDDDGNESSQEHRRNHIYRGALTPQYDDVRSKSEWYFQGQQIAAQRARPERIGKHDGDTDESGRHRHIRATRNQFTKKNSSKHSGDER